MRAGRVQLIAFARPEHSRTAIRLQLKHEEADILDTGVRWNAAAKNFCGSHETTSICRTSCRRFQMGAVWGKAAWLTHRMIPMNVTNEITTQLTSDFSLVERLM